MKQHCGEVPESLTTYCQRGGSPRRSKLWKLIFPVNSLGGRQFLPLFVQRARAEALTTNGDEIALLSTTARGMSLRGAEQRSNQTTLQKLTFIMAGASYAPATESNFMEINRVLVVGAGLMGSGIAQVCAQAGLELTRKGPTE